MAKINKYEQRDSMQTKVGEKAEGEQNQEMFARA